MKIHLFGLIFCSLILLPSCVNQTVLHENPYSVQNQELANPLDFVVKMNKLGDEMQNLAEKSVNQGNYADAIIKINQSIDYFKKIESFSSEIFGETYFDYVLADRYQKKTHYLILNHQIDKAKQNAQQTHEFLKERVVKNKENAQFFYHFAHDINKTANLFATHAQEFEFSRKMKMQIQDILADIKSKYPNLQQ